MLPVSLGTFGGHWPANAPGGRQGSGSMLEPWPEGQPLAVMTAAGPEGRLAMFWYGNGMGGWGWGLAAFSAIVFWALVVFLAVLVIRYFMRSGQRPWNGPSGPEPPAPPPGPEQVLAERYARGEIDEEEYRRRLETLRGAGAASGSAARPGTGGGQGATR
jgi:putative membrane protein